MTLTGNEHPSTAHRTTGLASRRCALAGFALGLAIVGGCTPGSEPTSPRASTTVAPVAVTSVALSVDGEKQAALTLPVVGGAAALDTLVPDHGSAAEWLRVEAYNKDGRFVKLTAPGKTHPNAKLTLRGASDGPRLELSRPVPATLKGAAARRAAAPIVSLAGVAELRITTAAKTHAKLTHVPLDVDVRLNGEARTFDAAAFAKVPSNGGRGRQRGRKLTDVVATQTPLDQVRRVELTGSSGDRHVLDRAALSDPAHVLVLKHSRGGALRFRQFKRSESTLAANIRDVTRIDIVTQSAELSADTTKKDRQ